MSEHASPDPDMSPTAVDRRLRDVSDLLELCRALQRGTLRPVGAGAEHGDDREH